MWKKGVIFVYEMKRRKGNGYVIQTYELNRVDYMILESLYSGGCKDRFHRMTITEISDDYDGSLGKRMTVWKKMQKLVSNGYLATIRWEWWIISNNTQTEILKRYYDMLYPDKLNDNEYIRMIALRRDKDGNVGKNDGDKEIRYL